MNLHEDLARRAEESVAERGPILEDGVAPDLIASIGKDERYVRVNLAYQTWFGLDPEQVQGKPIREVLGDEAYEAVRSHVRTVLSGREVTFEGLIPYRTGGVRHVRASYVPYLDSGGAVAGFVALVRDNSNARRVEEASILLAEIVRSSNDAIVTKSLDGIITSWNAGAERMFGYTPAEAMGRPITLLIPDSRLDEERMILDKVGRGERVEHYETVRRRKDGSEIHVSLTVSPVQDGAGRLIGASKIARDISDRVATEREIRRLNSDLERRVRERTASLEEMVRELNTFAYTVAHDLRAPLRSMQGFSQVLLEEQGSRLDEEGRGFARRIAAGAQRMDELIQALLLYSRLSREEVPLQVLELSIVLHKVLADMAPIIADAKAEVSIENPLPRIRGHAVTLSQAVSNLLENAVKFVPAGVRPSIRIRTESRGSWVRLWVEDNGIGIAPQHQGRLFRVFERLHDQEAYPGTGIGLAIVKRGLERMGGRSGLESEPGRGSRFWIEVQSAETNQEIDR